MSETSANVIEYRGYTLTAVRYGPGWRVQIYPGPGRLCEHGLVTSWLLQRRRRLRKRRQLSITTFWVETRSERPIVRNGGTCDQVALLWQIFRRHGIPSMIELRRSQYSVCDRSASGDERGPRR